MEEFKKRDLVCKLVSTATSQDGRFSAYVQPTLYPQGQPEAAVPANYNLITLEGNVSGRQSFFGQGAGRYPTAYNVVQDCADFLTGHGFYGPGGPKVSIDNSEKMVYYVRGEKDAWLVANGAESWGSAIVTKPVSVEDMHAWLRAHPGSFIAAVPSYL